MTVVPVLADEIDHREPVTGWYLQSHQRPARPDCGDGQYESNQPDDWFIAPTTALRLEAGFIRHRYRPAP